MRMKIQRKNKIDGGSGEGPKIKFQTVSFYAVDIIHEENSKTMNMVQS